MKILFPLSIIKVSSSVVIKSLNVWRAINLRKKFVFWEQNILGNGNNDVCKVSLLRNLFFGHMGFNFCLTINVGHYERSLSSCFFNHVLESFCSEIYAVLLNCPSFSLKTNLGDLLFILYYIYSVANANCYLYILVLILSELVIDCFELKTFIPLIFNWFLLLFTASTSSKMKLKKCLYLPNCQKRPVKTFPLTNFSKLISLSLLSLVVVGNLKELYFWACFGLNLPMMCSSS